MQLSKRLQAVADMVPKGSKVANIGCDHAYVSLYLVQNHIAETVIAMDVNKGPLQKAKENVEKYECSDLIDLRLSDGAMELQQGEADVLLIAGMGGGLVQKILSDSIAIVRECRALVLQPQSEVANVRKYVDKLGFQIVEEKILIDEGKFYMMFRAEQMGKCSKSIEQQCLDGLSEEYLKQEEKFTENQALKKMNNLNKKNSNMSETEYKYGKLLLEQKDRCLYEFLKKEKRKYKRILEQLEKSDMNKNKEQYEKMKQEYKDCKEGLRYYEM